MMDVYYRCKSCCTKLFQIVIVIVIAWIVLSKAFSGNTVKKFNYRLSGTRAYPHSINSNILDINYFVDEATFKKMK
jgi:hypothetical protein